MLLSLAEEVDLLLVASKRSLLGKFLLNSALAFFSRWQRHNVAFFEIVEQLTWHFFESLFGKLCGVVFEISERHELHNIGLHVLAVALRVERDLISVENVHGFEIV